MVDALVFQSSACVFSSQFPTLMHSQIVCVNIHRLYDLAACILGESLRLDKSAAEIYGAC
jgi:hypothetical protein